MAQGVRRRWRGALLVVVLGIALGVLAMHVVARPTTAGLDGSGTTVSQVVAADPQQHASVTGDSGGAGATDGCALCGHDLAHPSVMALCVLLLALLVVATRLPRPGPRSLMSVPARTAPTWVPVPHPRGALRLVELAVSRT